jgi:hypothetical protein
VEVDGDLRAERTHAPRDRRRRAAEELGLTELFSESHEPPFTEVPLEEFKRRFPEGRYSFAGTTVEGDELVGRARLSHDIPDGPEITSPADGEKVSRRGVVAKWDGPPEPPGIDIVGYRVIATREDPLRVYSVDVPASAREVPIPAAFPAARHRVRARDPGDRGERQPDFTTIFFEVRERSSDPSKLARGKIL